MAIDVVNEHGEIVQIPSGARQLGVRVKPLLRLGMGYKDETRRGAPVKTDYFTVRGDDRAVVKFQNEYGEKPKAVDILLPTELDVALTIQYRAFKGAAGGEGGTLVAVGATNFALRDYCGGPDLLTVFNQDGTVDESETLGLDANTREPLDEVAKTTGIELYTTLRCGLPRVLGFGSYVEITTKGKQSTDALWAKLRELYSLFGSRITFAVKPQLVLRPSTARPVVVKDGERKRTTTTIYALDIVVPETIDEMIGRLQERQQALAPAGPVAALYGGQAALPAAEKDRADKSNDQPSAGASDDEPEDADWAPVDEPTFDEKAVEEAGATIVPSGVHKGLSLADVAVLDAGPAWFLAQLQRVAATAPVRPALELYVQAKLPEQWKAYTDWKASQS